MNFLNMDLMSRQKALPIHCSREYQDADAVLQQLVAKLPWGHNLLLIQKLKDSELRQWYMKQNIENGWSRITLARMIENSLHERQGQTLNNFQTTLPPPQSSLAQQTLKDPYLFDFLSISDGIKERELELGLIEHLEKFLLELGQGFAFVGRQYPLKVSEQDFFLDLLFYHLELRCFMEEIASIA